MKIYFIIYLLLANSHSIVAMNRYKTPEKTVRHLPLSTEEFYQKEVAFLKKLPLISSNNDRVQLQKISRELACLLALAPENYNISTLQAHADQILQKLLS